MYVYRLCWCLLLQSWHYNMWYLRVLFGLWSSLFSFYSHSISYGVVVLFGTRCCDVPALFIPMFLQSSFFFCRFICLLVMCRSEMIKGFTDHLYTRLRTTTNYSVSANLHNSQITPAPAKPFPACCVFTSRSLVTAFNSVDSSASHAQVLSSQSPVQNSTEFIAPAVLVITYRHGSHRKHPVSNSNSTVASVFFAAGKCLLSRCPEAVAAYRVAA
jgi:hypothetical protein